MATTPAGAAMAAAYGQQPPYGTGVARVVAPRAHSSSPVVTGASVLAITYEDGVMMVCDTQGTSPWTSVPRDRPASTHRARVLLLFLSCTAHYGWLARDMMYAM